MNQRALSRGSWSRPYCTFHATSVLLLRRAQLARHSKAQKASPSPHAEGGEGWGEEGYSSWGRPVRQQLDAPLPSPLPARSSRGEGVGAVAHPADSSVTQRCCGAAFRNRDNSAAVSFKMRSDHMCPDAIANCCRNELHSGVIKQLTGASWILTALGAGHCLAEIPAPANQTKNLLEIRSLIVDGKPLDSHAEGEQRIGPFPESVTFEFGGRTNSSRLPIRLRYRLEGHEVGWHEGSCEMVVAIRFFDESDDQIAQNLFYARGDSSGWNGDLKTSTLTHRRETFTVPPKASRLWVVISSAGPPAAVGIFVVDDLVVRRLLSRNGLPDIVIQPPFDRQSAGLLTSQVPEGWMRDGYRPSMAKIVDLGIGLGARALAIWDDDPLGHAEWHTIKESAPRVVPGEQLVVEWNEMFSMGVGNVSEATYGRLAAGAYRFRVVETTPLGQPTGEEASIMVRVPPPLWGRPWFWAMVVTMLIAE